ncbi:SAV_2336 N-terminal domain-related protein [Streptomyces lancefieldiae]|uniref:SAV_2336 N-terminal domain-related protein n=1 Tax=Streptomyces lancefieldiae TaxID=3075520 RepID=A0ABU3AQI1_9ACTN|nr:SAV_2336 N-terminal domain-related protein [Streptomyces sp. DSM 40712]MDT0612075.1 SAV_2336 N-terminal domain-related protein [Streptomyces sp. DSM 40712]
MPSDHPGSPAPLPRLAEILARAASDVRPTPLELAELLWLAGQMEPVGDAAAPDEPDGPTRTDADGPPPSVDPGRAAEQQERRDREERRDPRRPQGDRDGRDRRDRPRPAPGAARTPLRLPSPAPSPGAAATEPHRSLLAPAPPMLRHPLALQRALRPLQRRTDAPLGRVVDERATADRIARLGADPRWWLPVMRPARERWLRLNLVHDAGPTMPVWRPFVRELHTVLAQSGVFRTVALHRAEPDGTVGGGGAHAPADGRTVTLLISDCMGPQWRQGPAGTLWYRTLRRWARQMPLAVVQPLPEHLWRDTALPPVPGRLSAPHRAAADATLTFRPYDTTVPFGPEGAVPVPVLEPDPRWLANWASLVASPGGTEHPGAAAPLHRPLPADADDRTDLAALSAEELVLRFRATASPEAFRLAGHLALGRPDLPVMRLVQAAVEPRPRPQHLAEVILSGMLTSLPGPAGSYAFRPGVRDLLLRGLPRTARSRTRELLLRAGCLIDERAGRGPGEFRALVPSPDGTERAVRTEVVATISQESARQLGAVARAPVASPLPPGLAGRYRPLRRLAPTGRLWLAEDGAEGRTVTIRLHETLTDRARREAFLRAARLLQGISHRNVVAVHDVGIDGDIPYVVMEHLDGIALNTLARSYGHRLPAPLTVSIGAQLARALAAVHEVGVTHGALETSRVVLLPDGTVRLSLFEPGRTLGPAGRSGDLRALCEVLLRLTSGTSHVTVPVDSRHLGHLPGSLRMQYAHAFDQLMSASPSTQARGRETLTHPVLSTRAREVYRRRRYRVLGPLRVDLPDGTPDLEPDVRALLAVLLLKHGRTVTHDELRWGLWDPGDEPGNPRAELARLANRLAAVLGPGVLATPAHGYAVHTSADYVDVVHCDYLVRRADMARLEGSLADARDRVAEALALWRGAEPLANVPGPAARTARTRLQRLRLALYTKRAEIDLALGRYAHVSTDLAGLLRAHPHREDFRRLYLIALRGQGRGEEALEVYEEYELSGGRSPALAALGRELREEHEPAVHGPWREYADQDADGAGGGVLAPDELPEGPFPTEDALWTPLLGEPEEPDRSAESADDLDHETALERAEILAEVAADAAAEAAEEAEAAEAAEADAGFDTDFRDCVRYAFADGARGDEAPAALRGVVTDLLTDSGLDGDAYRLLDDPDGVLVLLGPRVEAARLLRATVEGLPGRLARVGGLRLRVDFWQAEFRPDGSEEQVFRADAGSVDAALDASGAQAVVALSDSLYRDVVYEERQDGPTLAPDAFRPLADATGWYRLVVGAGGPEAAAPAGGAVRGPFPMPAGGWVPVPRDASRAVVLRLPGGDLALPDSPRVRSAPDRTRAAWQYFEVDLSEHVLATGLPGVDAVWRVADPVEAVAGRRTDLRAVIAELTEGPLAAVREGRTFDLERVDVPGYDVRWSFGPRPDRAPDPAPAPAPAPALAGTRARVRRAAVSPADLIAGARCVLLGFDDVVARLYRPAAEREVLLDIARLVVEGRDPEDALAGVPLPRAASEGYAGTLDLIRALAGHRLAQDVRLRLERHEERAARTARATPLAARLVLALDTRKVPTAVVTDRAPAPVAAYLRRRNLLGRLTGGVHGRDADLSRLMPDPDVLHRALERLGAPADACVLIGSCVAEQSAARAVGLPFIGYWRGERVRRELRAADGDALLVPDLRALLTAAENR